VVLKKKLLEPLFISWEGCKNTLDDQTGILLLLFKNNNKGLIGNLRCISKRAKEGADGNSMDQVNSDTPRRRVGSS
jgi:hypothetical protein